MPCASSWAAPVARAADGVELVACDARLLSSGSPAILVCGTGGTRLRHGRAEAKNGLGFWEKPVLTRLKFFVRGPAMLLRFALLVGGTHKARVIATLLLLHFGLAALNHYIEIGEIESDRQRLEGVFGECVACYDYIPWLIALSVSVLAGFAETFGVILLWYLPEVTSDGSTACCRSIISKRPTVSRADLELRSC